MYLNENKIVELISFALNEDLGNGDITSDLLFDGSEYTHAEFVVKEPGIIAGLNIIKYIFDYIDPDLEFETYYNDGDRIDSGDVVASLSGSVKNILMCERTALNILQRLSGIATKTALFSNLVKEFNVKITDTRKTTPGLRIFEKYAVRIGGGYNHRFGLYDGILIKDNHKIASGGIKKTIERIRKKAPHTLKIEVETTNINEVQEAIESNADIILLDNMSYEDMRRSVSLINGRAITEASGGIKEDDLIEVAKTGVDIISIGELTHSIRSLDISLDFRTS